MMAAILYRLWAMSLQAGILIFIVLAMRFFLSRYPRIYSYCLWVLVGIRLLCPVWVESPFSLQPDFAAYSDRMGQTEESGGTFRPDILSGQEQVVPVNEGMDMEGEGQQPAAYGGGQPGAPQEGEASGEKAAAGYQAPSGEADFLGKLESILASGTTLSGEDGLVVGKLYRILGIVYLAGAAGVLLFYMAQYLWMRHKVSAAVREKGNVWLCDGIASPFVMGIIFPRIYLPYAISGMEKKYVLRHERIHIRHHDPLIRMIGTFCICLHWWNPLVWLAVYLMNQDMEMFCDETVLRHAPLAERKAYAKTLLSFAEKESRLGAGLAFGESHTEKRVKNIMKKRKRSIFIVCLVAALAVFCVAALLTVPRAGDDGSGEEDPGNTPEGDISLSQSPSPDASGEGGAAASGSKGILSDADLSWLMEICPGIPDFTSKGEMDAAFWENYLFSTYTSDFGRGEVNRYSEQYGFEIPYVEVSYEEADGTIRQIFGESLAGYGISPEMLGADSNNLILEDDSLFVAVSDSPVYQFSFEDATTTDILTEVSLLKSTADGEAVSRVMLYLLPAENERGFVLDGKEEILIPQVPDGEVLENQSYEIEMNPYGKVTFAVYAPDVSTSPYADVTYKLLQDGQEIYSFPLKGTGVRQDQSVFAGMAAVAFPDLNGDGYTDVVTIAHYEHESGPVPSQVRIFTYNPGGYFLEELYFEDAYNFSHEEKTVADIEAFAAQRENQDYFVRTSIYGRWQVSGYRLPGVYALAQEEIDSYVGAMLEYGVTSLWTNTDGETSTVIGYERETVTAAELGEGFKINTAELGIPEDELVYYQVNAEKDSLFGCFFYLVDPEHALIYYEGVFFEAVRE